MAYKNQDFEIFAGDNKLLVFTVDDVGDLGDCVVTWEAARSPDSEALISKSSEDSDEIEISGDTFTVKLVPDDTAELSKYRKYYHEAQIEDSAGNITTVAIGTMIVYPQLIV